MGFRECQEVMGEGGRVLRGWQSENTRSVKDSARMPEAKDCRDWYLLT